MKNLIVVILTLISGFTVAQNTPKAPRVSGAYVAYKSGAKLVAIGSRSAFTAKPMEDREASGTEFTESTYVDYEQMKYFQTAKLPDGSVITVETPFEYNKGLEIIGKETYAGWECQIARTIINSNTVEIWYTNNLGFNGTPLPSIGVPEGLVVKVLLNGNAIFDAQIVNQMTQRYELFPESFGKIVSGVEYRSILNNIGVKTFEVFKNERIGYEKIEQPVTFSDTERLYRVGNGTVIMKKVRLPEITNIYNIFAQVVQYSDGDAYDRTGSIFVIPVGKEKSYLDAMSDKGLESLPFFTSESVSYHGLTSTPQYDVPVEMMRFFTSFGVRGYNHIQVKGQTWADSVIYKADVTHLASLLKGEVWIGAYIGNWDAKGHIISLDLKYHETGEESKERLVIPLFNTVHMLEQAGQPHPVFMEKDMLSVNFGAPRGYKNAQIVYTTTGHGGWSEGDEFTQKPNTIYLNNKKVFSFIPWREDCATYRNLNPASGNFPNGLSSSDLSRSNWCPGTLTNPVYIPLGDLKKGKYTLKVQIPQGEKEENGISYWCISAYLLVDKE